MTLQDNLPEDIELLVEQHNKNHDKIDRIKSWNQRKNLQHTNKEIRNKLVIDCDVPREKVNQLVNENVPPKKFREEVVN